MADSLQLQDPRQHGGTDALGSVRWDFSSNANACGPCPSALRAVQQADPQRYPDPAYSRLRQALAGLHGVSSTRLLLAASASECIQRLTAWRWRAGDRHFWTPPHAYGDYTHAALAWGMQAVTLPSLDAQASKANGQGQLRWLCDPGSPLGQSESPQTLAAVLSDLSSADWQVTWVLDRAYAPLRLQGQSALSASQLEQVWQLWSPNKALGLTGVRAAYAIAPVGHEADVVSLDALAASWPIGAHGEAMLLAWTLDEPQHWVAQTRQTLAEWVLSLRQTLQKNGWTCLPTETHYLCAKPPTDTANTNTKTWRPLNANTLRQHGIKCRDATSFGLPGWWRFSAQPPEALVALNAALQEISK